MNEIDFADIIRLVRRAPLTNMDEAERVAKLLQKYASFVNNYLNNKDAQVELPLKVVDK